TGNRRGTPRPAPRPPAGHGRSAALRVSPDSRSCAHRPFHLATNTSGGSGVEPPAPAVDFRRAIPEEGATYPQPGVPWAPDRRGAWAMTQISLTFPDGNSRDYAKGVTAAEVAQSIAPSLAKAAISASLDGRHWDLQWPITQDAKIAIHTMKDEAQALELIRHDFAHVMARAVQKLWPEV